MFRNRTFAISFVLMFVLGFVLFGTTVLIPQFAQTILGYTAEQAGLVISPGGVMVMLMMPLVGFLAGRVDPRYLVAFGFAMLSAALVRMHSLDAADQLQLPRVAAGVSGFGICLSLRAYQHALLHGCSRSRRTMMSPA